MLESFSKKVAGQQSATLLEGSITSAFLGILRNLQNCFLQNASRQLLLSKLLRVLINQISHKDVKNLKPNPNPNASPKFCLYAGTVDIFKTCGPSRKLYVL